MGETISSPGGVGAGGPELTVSDFMKTVLDDPNAATAKETLLVPTQITIPETRTYAWPGAFTLTTVFPPFHVDESIGVLTLTKVVSKLTSGTATIKIRVNGVDEVVGLGITNAENTHDFADEPLADLNRIDIVPTAVATPLDLSVTFFFTRVITL